MKHISILILVLLAIVELNGKHIVGGDMICSFVEIENGNTTYDCQLIMYRDCNQEVEFPSPFDPEIPIGIYRMNSGFVEYSSEISVDLSKMDIVKSNCLCFAPISCVDLAIYKFTVTLPVIDENYILAYQRCCYSAGIVNIYIPEVRGLAITCEIPPILQTGNNNVPVFNILSDIIDCVDKEVSIDVSGMDPDGDLLEYELVAPYAAGGPILFSSGDCDTALPDPARCMPPFESLQYIDGVYSLDRPIPGFALDSIEGIYAGQHNILGQFLVGVKINEFRDSILIGTYRRTFQLAYEVGCDDNVTSVEELEEEANSQIAIFPNPTSDEVFIESNIPVASIIVYDNTGKQVMQQPNVDNSISLAGLPSGVYYVELQTPEGKSIVRRVVALK